MAQFENWLVCQACGRVTSKGDSKGWLNQPHKERFDVRVVRCPPHITEWSLQHTREGRTNKNRELLAEGRKEVLPPFPPDVSPFPMTDEEA